MNHHTHNKIVSFIWKIADDRLRDVYVRGKYRDVILPMVVLRRLDSLLEATKDAVLEEVEFQRKEMNNTELDPLPLRSITGFPFYNTSEWTLVKLYHSATNNPKHLLANFESYFNGFSENIQEIIQCFNLREQIRHMLAKDILLGVVSDFVSEEINLSPQDKTDSNGNILPALTNLGMGYVFEELIRKFNEENNEEAGEHFTPREVIELMVHLIFDPIADAIPPAMTIYDPACGSGGMLTEAQNFIAEKYQNNAVYLYGKEINEETYAICKSDMMIKGNNAENIKYGSTLAQDSFAGIEFHYMMSNPPYGKSWKNDYAYIKDGNDIIDPRFQVELTDYFGAKQICDATPRSSDGQLLFLMEMVSKMIPVKNGVQGSRIASVHNGSSLFTGDAGSGESNIRRYLIENDLLEAIVQLPNNMFYNTGITTYIWLLSNNKPTHRKGKVQLIDASALYQKLRKNLGDKNCEFSPVHIARISHCHLDFLALEKEENLSAKIFDNKDFGYHKVNILRPDRRKVQFTTENIASLRFDKSLLEPMQFLYETFGEKVYADELANLGEKLTAWAEKNGYSLSQKDKLKILKADIWKKSLAKFQVAERLLEHFGNQVFMDFNQFVKLADDFLKQQKIKLSASDKKAIFNAVSVYDETAKKVIQKIHTFSDEKLKTLLLRLDTTAESLPDFGYFPTDKPNEFVSYENNTELNDSENIPLTQSIHAYFLAEVKPHIAEAWIDLESVKIGYEISFNKYFYEHKALRSIEEIKADILELEKQADGLIGEILGV